MTQTLRRITFQAMGSFCDIQIYNKSRVEGRKQVKILVNEVNRLEKKYSRFSQDSFVAEINASAGYDLGLKIDTETLTLFDHARSCHEQSDGLFDITSAVLSKLWDFNQGKVPTPEEIEKALPLVGFDKLELNNSRLKMPANMEIDFGGIVKEYAADSAARLGRSLNIEQGLINLGGDFAVIGAQPDEQPWPVGVSDPQDSSKLIAKIALLDGGLASSGDYERFFEHEGKRYSHIINPLDGWPSSGLRAVSVAANLCTVAGSMATVAMLKPETEGIKWLQESGLPHVYMTHDEQVGGAGLT